MRPKSQSPNEERRAVRRPLAPGIVIAVEGWVGLPVELKDLSLGGFAISSAKPFSSGMTQDFTFTREGGFSFGLVAKAVHCTEAPDGRFISGWEFCKAAGDDILIRQLLEDESRPE